MQQKILVTGATGLLGNCVVRELLERGYGVRALVRAGQANGASTEPRRELAGLDIEVITGPLSDSSVLERAVRGCQAVIHSAAMIHIGYHRREEARVANVEGSRAVAEACLLQGAKLVYISTVDTLPAATAPDSPLDENACEARQGVPKTACTYVISKQAAEQEVIAVHRRGLEAVILHPGFMLGPYDWKPSSGAMMLAVHKSPVIVAPRGTASVCDARDVSAAVVSSIERGRNGQHYILAGKNLAYTELCKQILVAMGQTKRVFKMGPVIPAAARMVDLWYRLPGTQEKLFNGAAIAMGGLHHAYDSSKAERELAYAHRPLDETLRDAWQWISAHHL